MVLFCLSLAACGDDETSGSTDGSIDAQIDATGDAGVLPDGSEDDASTGEMCVVTAEYDDLGDGVDRVRIDNVDPDGKVLIESLDLELGGDYEQVSTYAYNEAGLVESVASDFDGDGVPNSWLKYEYDSEGRRTRQEHGSGELSTEPTLAFIFIYDENGNRIEEQRDGEADGSIDDRHIYENTYDGDELVSVRVDEYNDEEFDRQTDYTYSDGRIATVTTTILSGPDAGSVSSVSYEYDAMGRTTRVGFDTDGDETEDEERVFTYEGDFLVSIVRQTTDSEPVNVDVRTLTYEGTCSPNYDPRI